MFIPAAIGAIGSMIGGVGTAVGGILGGVGAAAGGTATAGTSAAGGAAAAGISASTALADIGLGTSILGSVQGAMAKNASAKFNANEAALEQKETANQEVANIQKQDVQEAQIVGAQDVGYGASNVDTSAGGSAAQVKSSSQAIAKYDIDTTIQNYALQQQALATQKAGYQASTVSPFLAGTTTALQGIASMNNQKYNKLAASNGVFPQQF